MVPLIGNNSLSLRATHQGPSPNLSGGPLPSRRESFSQPHRLEKQPPAPTHQGLVPIRGGVTISANLRRQREVTQGRLKTGAESKGKSPILLSEAGLSGLYRSFQLWGRGAFPLLKSGRFFLFSVLLHPLYTSLGGCHQVRAIAVSCTRSGFQLLPKYKIHKAIGAPTNVLTTPLLHQNPIK